jgi:hypothetical protein
LISTRGDHSVAITFETSFKSTNGRIIFMTDIADLPIVDIPPDFEPDSYLELNPDLRVAGVDPVAHYSEYGTRELRLWKKSLPPTFEEYLYRKTNADISHLSAEDLFAHFQTFGRHEGRVASPAAVRSSFLKLVPSSQAVLEIGPFARPCVSGTNVSYFDVLDKRGLEKRALAIKYPVTLVPDIQFVSPNGDLSVVKKKFHGVVSSHCIEHQADLIYHLHHVERLLHPNGMYFLIIPDKRYCFDYGLSESNLAQVLSAHKARQRIHRMESVIEHLSLTTHNDPLRHWTGDHYDAGWSETVPGRAKSAIQKFNRSRGKYIDVHAWQFTPMSFGNLMRNLFLMKLIGLEPIRIYDTPFGRNEFTVVLKKTTNLQG